MGSLAYLSVTKRPFTKEILTLNSNFMHLGISERGRVLASIEAKDKFVDENKAKQLDDKKLKELKENMVNSKAHETTLYAEGAIMVKGRICVFQENGLIQILFTESHGLRYFIISGLTKMYKYLKRIYWWSGMNKNIVYFVEKCQNCQQVKYEHQRPAGLFQRMPI